MYDDGPTYDPFSDPYDRSGADYGPSDRIFLILGVIGSILLFVNELLYFMYGFVFSLEDPMWFFLINASATINIAYLLCFGVGLYGVFKQYGKTDAIIYPIIMLSFLGINYIYPILYTIFDIFTIGIIINSIYMIVYAGIGFEIYRLRNYSLSVTITMIAGFSLAIYQVAIFVGNWILLQYFFPFIDFITMQLLGLVFTFIAAIMMTTFFLIEARIIGDSHF